MSQNLRNRSPAIARRVYFFSRTSHSTRSFLELGTEHISQASVRVCV